ncbi:MerR family transcriptional regulator [Sinimarinibacterium sp. CAU 1509]|uniref:MerR family transcriptional regulator n=1 Tax=Sinimarinibacterium sp. CAU 1509 TaxID=2562283 RepID=UPI0010AD50F7|nr:MerR family transcriptional regulator [Sinimarinibacterium sp. CAU 1509]TJY64780.1 MerR family transcriptional regulator [Sinimarinibacterium sp. CAU 1509]
MAPPKKSTARPRAAARPAPYKIKDVSEITGVSRETIRFYINEGLLPPPEKSARNMGWYTQHHIDLLQLIQKLQREQFLPLKAIKSLVHGSSDFEFTTQQEGVLAQIRNQLSFGSRGLLPSGKPGAIARDLGLTRKELKEFDDIGLTLAKDATVSDIEVAELWIKLKKNGLSEARGFTPKDLGYLVELVDFAVQAELRLFEQKIQTMSPDEGTRLSEVVIPTLSRVFAILHERRLGMFIERYLAQRSESRVPARRVASAAARGSADGRASTRRSKV